MDHSHLPPNRKRSEAECKATVMLLNGDKVGAYWYGSKGHVIIHDSAWEEEDEEDYGDRSENTRTYVDADTMEPITRKEVFRRINAYDEWMQERANEAERGRAYSAGNAVGHVLPRR